MKIAILTVDHRAESGRYEEPLPRFHPAVTDLLRGFEGCDCEIHVISCGKKPLASPGRLGANITFHGLAVPQVGWLRTLYSGCILGIRNTLRAIGPDIVHGQGTERYCGMAAALSGYPNVVTVHGNMRSVATSLNAKALSYLWMSARLERFALARADGVVCLSSLSRKLVQALNRRVWQIPNAVDAALFNVPGRSDGRTLLCVADVIPYKNQIGLIEALDGWDPIRKSQLVFAGRLPDKSLYAERFLAMVKERSWCRYEGAVDRARVAGLLQTAAAVIHPSLEDNCPMVILEAMAAGVPVAASGIGGIPDIIRDRQSGLIFDPLSQESIRQAARVLLEDPAAARALAEGGRAAAVERHAPEKIALEHLRVYREVLAGADPFESSTLPVRP